MPDDKRKKPSGAANRAARRAREVVEGGAKFSEEVQALLDQLGPPPLGKAHGRVAWANRVLGILAWAALTQRTVDTARIRLVKELFAVMGMTFPRTELEELAEEGDKQKRPTVEGQTEKPAPGTWKKKHRGSQGQASAAGKPPGDPSP